MLSVIYNKITSYLNLADDEKLKVYILNYTCALTRHTNLEVSQNRSYESTKAALLRIFFERGAPQVIVSDQEATFKNRRQGLLQNTRT